MKRKSTDLQKEIYNAIKVNPGITMHELERKIGTNPRSLAEHCWNLEHFKLITVVKDKKTRRLYVHKKK